MAENPFKSGTDTYKFFEALSPFAQQEMLKNPYAVNTAWATLKYGGGLDAALKNPEQIIYMTPSGLDISPTSYAAYEARHPSVGPRELDMSFSDFLLQAGALVATPFIPGIASGLGAAIAPAANTAVQAAIGNAIVQGTLAEAQGGDFLKGAALSGANSALGGYVRPELVEATGSNALANALTSGTMAELSGGEFLQGAIQGGISGATQDVKLALADKYLNAVEPGIGYNPATSPTELDVIQAFPELAPPSDNFSQGVTDILDYAAKMPSVQVAGYFGEIPNAVYDPITDSYITEIIGKKWTLQDEIEYQKSLEENSGNASPTPPTEQDVLAAFPELTPNVADAFPELFQNNQDLPIPTEVFIPKQSVQDVVNTISADVSVANPSLTADEVRSIVEGSISNLPPGLSAEDVRTIVPDSLTNLPAAPTQQDIIDIIGGQNFATPDDIRTAISGIQFPAGMTPQDVQNIVSQAFQNNPGINATDVQGIVQGALNNLPPGLSSDDVRNIVTDAVSNIPAAPTEQDIINIIGGQGLASTAQLSEQGKSLMNALQAQGMDYQTALNQALNAQASNFQGQLTDVQAGLGSQISNLSQQTQQQLAQQSTQTQQQFQNLSDAQKAQANALVNQGASLNSALSQVQSGLQSQIGGVQAGLESQLSAQGKQFMNALQAQGVDYQTALNQAVTAQSNQFSTSIQDVVNQIGNVQTGLETQLNQQGRDFMDYLQQQGFDYETSLTEAIEAQKNEFGTALNQTTEDLLNQLSSTGSGLQTQFETGLQGLADQLGITQQELINQLNQTQESFGSELSNLQTQLTDFDTTNAERYADLIKTVGLVGTGLGALQSNFDLFRDQNTPKQFEVVAPPSDWTSPVYGTPTAPVSSMPSSLTDFGSTNLLQGTQFARPAAQPFQMPYDLSNMVNTLNFQSVPFVQQQMPPSFTGIANQPTPGLSNIIGNLNGTPVSIADIISNIQGQYGQKAAS